MGAGAATQCASATPPDGDPGAGGTGECSNGLGERSTGAREVLWPTTAQVWDVSGEREAGRGVERGGARSSGAAVSRNRIAERAHQGIRRTDGKNRQGRVPGSGLAEAGEGRGNTDRSDVCPDDRGPVSVCEESPGRLFSGVTTWPQELRGERTTEGDQQRRRPVSAHDDGARSALHSGTFWRRQRSAEMGTQAGGARREKCQEASGRGRGSKAGGPAASVVGRGRGVRTTAQ